MPIMCWSLLGVVGERWETQFLPPRYSGEDFLFSHGKYQRWQDMTEKFRTRSEKENLNQNKKWGEEPSEKVALKSPLQNESKH